MAGGWIGDVSRGALAAVLAGGVAGADSSMSDFAVPQIAPEAKAADSVSIDQAGDETGDGDKSVVEQSPGDAIDLCAPSNRGRRGAPSDAECAAAGEVAPSSAELPPAGTGLDVRPDGVYLRLDPESRAGEFDPDDIARRAASGQNGAVGLDVVGGAGNLGGATPTRKEEEPPVDVLDGLDLPSDVPVHIILK